MAAAVRSIRFSDVLGAPNADALIADYAAECSIPSVGAVNPQAQIYAALEQSGALRVFGAYDGETLVGFATVLVAVNPHYGEKVATVESLFAAKEHRIAAGRLLLQMVEDYASFEGCAAIFYSAPVGSQLEKVLSKRASCIRTNAVFCRRLA